MLPATAWTGAATGIAVGTGATFGMALGLALPFALAAADGEEALLATLTPPAAGAAGCNLLAFATASARRYSSTSF
jgi:hypothetical protein